MSDSRDGSGLSGTKSIRNFCTVCDCTVPRKTGIVEDGRNGVCSGPVRIAVTRGSRRSDGETEPPVEQRAGAGGPRPKAVIEDVSLAEATRSRYLNYALSVITSRALPDVRDGLKPVQRRILYAMWHDLHVTADGRYIKCGGGRRRGDEELPPARRPVDLRRPGPDGPAVQPAASADRGLRQFRLDRRRPAGRDAVHRVPADADRRRSCSSELRDQTVDFRPNYASTTDEPVVLPGPVPQPAGQRRVGDRRRHGDEHPAAQPQGGLQGPGRPARQTASCRSRSCLKHIHGPDFPTGGVILNSADEIRQIYATGQGTIKLRGTYEPDPEKAEHGPDHVDPLRDREGRPGRSGSAS